MATLTGSAEWITDHSVCKELRYWFASIVLPQYATNLPTRFKAIKLAESTFSKASLIHEAIPFAQDCVLFLVQQEECIKTKQAGFDVALTLLQTAKQSTEPEESKYWKLFCCTVSFALTSDILRVLGEFSHDALMDSMCSVEGQLQSWHADNAQHSAGVLRKSDGGAQVVNLLKDHIRTTQAATSAADLIKAPISAVSAMKRLQSLPPDLLLHFCGHQHTQNIWTWVGDAVSLLIEAKRTLVHEKDEVIDLFISIAETFEKLDILIFKG